MYFTTFTNTAYPYKNFINQNVSSLPFSMVNCTQLFTFNKYLLSECYAYGGTGEKGHTGSKQMNTKAKHAREPDRFFFCPRPTEMCTPQKQDRGM